MLNILDGERPGKSEGARAAAIAKLHTAIVEAMGRVGTSKPQVIRKPGEQAQLGITIFTDVIGSLLDDAKSALQKMFSGGDQSLHTYQSATPMLRTLTRTIGYESLGDTSGYVSEKHFMIAAGPDGATITDLGSTNGTKINGSSRLIPNSPIAIRVGDVIDLANGEVSLRVDRSPSGDIILTNLSGGKSVQTGLPILLTIQQKEQITIENYVTQMKIMGFPMIFR